MKEVKGMKVLGINGGFSKLENDFVTGLPEWFFHDSSAALLDDTKLIAAHEEERLNRLKHTNKFPINAIQRCLGEAEATIDSVDFIAYPFEEEFCDSELNALYIHHGSDLRKSARQHIAEWISSISSSQFDDKRIIFNGHHLSHATSAYLDS